MTETITEQDLRECLSFLEKKHLIRLSSSETKPYYDHIITQCLWMASYEGYKTRKEYYEHMEYLFKSNVLSHYTVITTPTPTPKQSQTNFCYIKE